MKAASIATPPELGEDALGLLDHDPGGQRPLQLFGLRGRALGGALLEDHDGGNVCLRLRDHEVVAGELLVCPEQVQCSDDLASESHRQRVH